MRSDSRTEPQVESAAFRQAQLKSERFRILVVLSAVVAILLLRSIRMLILHAHEHRKHFFAKLLFVAFFVLYELAMLSCDPPHFIDLSAGDLLVLATDARSSPTGSYPGAL